MSGATYLIALGVKISMAMVMMLLIGLLFLVLGNYFLFLSDLQKEKLTAGGKSLTVVTQNKRGGFYRSFCISSIYFSMVCICSDIQCSASLASPFIMACTSLLC